MKFSRRGFVCWAATAAAPTMATQFVWAQSYPIKSINIVVPFGPGSGTDTVTRVVAQSLGVAFNQAIVIENKPGANGAIAATQVARSAPDGYTLLMTTNSPHSAAPSLNKTLNYDPISDFVPVTRVGSYTFVVAVHPSLPMNSISELIAYAKANPGKLSYASGNTSGIVAGETLKRRANIDVLHVPYKTVPPALNDVLGGRVPMILADLTPALPHIRAGTLRPLAITRIQRSALLPDVPTLHESGISGFDMDSWVGLVAPAKTPLFAVSLLNTELRRIIDSQDVKRRLGEAGFEAFSSTPEAFGEFIKTQLIKWTEMIKEAQIQPE